MKKTGRIASLLLTVCLCLFTAAACGSGTNDRAASGSSNGAGNGEKGVKVIDINLTDEEYAYGVDKAQPELLKQVNGFIDKIKADGTLDEINNRYFGGGTPVPVTSAEQDPSRDQLVVATNASFEPFEYTQGGTYLGIDMEIAKMLADHLGKELVISNMNFDTVCLSVGQHKCDIAMSGLTVKPSREEYVTFSTPYYNASQKLVCLNSDTTYDSCETPADVEAVLNGYDSSTKAGAQNGTTGMLYLAGDAEWEFPGFPVTAVGYANGSLAIQDIINGNLSFVIIDSAPADCIARSINAMQ